MSLELGAVIHFLWPKHIPNQAILAELEEVYGKDVISLRAVEKWTTTFDGRGTEFADLPWFGRPRDTGKVNTVRAWVEGEGCLSQKKIAQMLRVHYDAVKCLLHDDFDMRKGNFEWVPHPLDRSQKAVPVQVSRELLDFLESRTSRSLSNVYTGDETWVYLDNRRTSVWISADVARPIRV
jgi:hypothetical protein